MHPKFVDGFAFFDNYKYRALCSVCICVSVIKSRFLAMDQGPLTFSVSVCKIINTKCKKPNRRSLRVVAMYDASIMYVRVCMYTSSCVCCAVHSNRSLSVAVCVCVCTIVTLKLSSSFDSNRVLAHKPDPGMWSIDY